MSKTIIFCADGTWNGSEAAAGADSLQNDLAASKLTNVYKFFDRLNGNYINGDHELGLLKSLTKEFTDADGNTQIAMYCHGVGDNHWLLSEKLLGGAIGAGLTTRLRLGYDFISKHFEKDSNILIVGFSRGAYTARALADLIGAKGLLRPDLANDHSPIGHAAAAWLDYRKDELADTKSGLAAELVTASQLFHSMMTPTLHPTDFVDATVTAIAVWDTVSAMGFPDYTGTVRDDDFEFAAKKLGKNIRYAFHAVSIDEMRLDYRPTLWSEDPRVVQQLFAGDHKDVGGGHLQSGLSDGALKWILEQLSIKNIAVSMRMPISEIIPDDLGPAHRTWEDDTLHIPKLGSRDFRGMYVFASAQVEHRIGKLVHVGTAYERYEPTNLFPYMRAVGIRQSCT